MTRLNRDFKAFDSAFWGEPLYSKRRLSSLTQPVICSARTCSQLTCRPSTSTLARSASVFRVWASLYGSFLSSVGRTVSACSLP
ncbi:MAG: hypothetical protein HYZ65_02705 [Burkholderiales bacterium]|nr:hypothetical protein [Burkholderiales bacterium]